jgi:hypothetical protein
MDPQAAITAEERRALLAEGWLRLRAVLDPRALELMRCAWEARLSGVEGGANAGPPGLEQDPAFEACRSQPWVLSAVAALLDGDLTLISLRGRDPPRGHGRQGLHADYPGVVEPDRQMLANAFWALDDMDEANGATRLVPGAHRLRQLPRGPWAQPHGRHPEERTLEARAGDVIVFSGHLWHAGSLNRSGARRRVVIAQFGRREVARAFQSARGAETWGAEA